MSERELPDDNDCSISKDDKTCVESDDSPLHSPNLSSKISRRVSLVKQAVQVDLIAATVSRLSPRNAAKRSSPKTWTESDFESKDGVNLTKDVASRSPRGSIFGSGRRSSVPTFRVKFLFILFGN